MPISKILSIILGLLILTIGSSARQDGASPLSHSEIPRADPEALNQELLEEGDILLRKGRSFVSELISLAFNGDVSHCGIVIRDSSEWKIVHILSGRISEQDGIRMERVEDFISEALPGSVYHIKPVVQLSRTAMLRESRAQIKLQPKFDHQFNLEDESKLYCSELVRLIYLKSGSPDLFSYKVIGGKSLIDMDSFLNPDFFQVMQAF